MVKKIINLAQMFKPSHWRCSIAIVFLFILPSIVSLLPAPLSQALVWMEEKQAYAAIITLSGSCKRVNQVTDCSDTGTVRFAVNGVLQPQIQTVVGGTWTISGADVLSGDVITVFIDGASNIREAVAVTRYDGTGNITGIELLEKHLSIGSDDNQTISNNDLSLYDNSASFDEDIFYEVSSTNDLTVDTFGVYTTEKLYIKSGNTFQPDSTGSGNVSSQDIEINGTFIADSNNITLNGYWTNNSIFTAGTSTVTFTAGSGTERIDSTSASISSFYNLSFNDGGGNAVYQLESDLSVLNDLRVVDGLLNTKSGSNYAVNVGRDWLQTGGRVEARLSTLTVARDFVADGSEINDGYNDAHLIMTGTGSLTYNNLSGFWSRGFRYLTVGQSGNVTTLNSDMAVIRQLVVGSGGLNGNSASLYLLGILTPLEVHTTSTIDINQLRFFGNGTQSLPPLSNGYDATIKLIGNGTIVEQAGHITLNSNNGLILNGDTFVDRAVTYNTNGFNLTVGGSIQVGHGSDTAQKRFDITGSTVTVGGNIEVRSGGSVQADIISTGSTVILNGSALQTITTNSSDFNNLTVSNASDVTFADAFTTTNFTNITPNSTMTFKGGQTYPINGTLNLNGQAANSKIQLRSSDTSQYTLNVTAATQTVQYVDVAYATASSNDIQAFDSTNSGNNDNADPTPHWVFIDELLVTNTLDTNTLGTLRYALSNVSAGETISFDPSVFLTATPATISLTSPLPNITQGSVTLDASNAGVIIRGSSVQDCLKIDSNYNTIKGLRIQNCTRDGIGLYSGSGNTIGGDNSVGSGPSGEGNIIVYNGSDGIDVSSSATGNFIYGNYIGTDPNSSIGVGNGVDGINMRGSSNVIGGTGSGQSNVISNNGDDGIQLSGDSNTVQANYIGTNVGGTAILGNTDRGIDLSGSSNTIGGNSSAARNIISGNIDGLLISSNTSNNVISGNYIGTDVTGLAALGNTQFGIVLFSGSSNATIGGTSSGERNIISGNGATGIRIFSSIDNNIIGNYIGVDSTGNVALANGGRGIELRGATTSGTMIGGIASGSANVISGNAGDGIQTTGTTTIIGNYIGTNASDTTLPNGGDGIEIWYNSPVTLGHASETQGNIFGNNGGNGIYLGQGSLTIAGNVDLNDDISLASGQTLALGAGTLNISGDWLNSGTTVTADTSTVEFDGTNQSVSGNTTFYNLIKSVSTADTLTFNANSTQTIETGGTVTLSGTSGQLLTLASSTSGTHWNLNLETGVTKAISYVNVQDSNASGSDSSLINISPSDSIDSGNNVSWFGSATITVVKSSTLISDPINGTGAGKNHIPGAIVEYTLTVTNSGDSSPDVNSLTITDVLDANVEYVASSISFAPENSGLTEGTVTYNSGTASLVITTLGTFNHTDTPDPHFIVTYRVMIR